MNSRKNAKGNKTAAETAYAYLASRMRTEAEMRKHLEDKGFEKQEIDETIRDLAESRYLDDYQYALRYFEYNHEKRRGTLRAVRELADKGVDPAVVRNAREDFIYENSIDEYRDALSAAEKLRAMRPDGTQIDERFIGSVARKLESRGFARDTIFRVLDKLRSCSEEDAE